MKRINNLPSPAKWLGAVIFFIAGAYLSFQIFIVFSFPFSLLLLPVIKPIGHFFITPLLKLTRFFKYYSPMVLLINPCENTYEIHNGTALDYLINMKWSQRGLQGAKRIIVFYLEGFLNIIKEIESHKLSLSARIKGTSYFFNEKTAAKLGFQIEKPGLFVRLGFFLDFVNLFTFYSYSKGRIAVPNILRIKKVTITGVDLVQRKEKIIELLNILNKNKISIKAA